jgi:hypothetical protein
MNAFDDQVARASGNAADLIRRFYNRELSQNSAKKYLAGIRMFGFTPLGI